MHSFYFKPFLECWLLKNAMLPTFSFLDSNRSYAFFPEAIAFAKIPLYLDALSVRELLKLRPIVCIPWKSHKLLCPVKLSPLSAYTQFYHSYVVLLQMP